VGKGTKAGWKAGRRPGGLPHKRCLPHKSNLHDSRGREELTSRPPAGLPVWHARLRAPRDWPVWQARRLEELRLERFRSYQIPISFHQAKPTVDQMARLASETRKPTYHQRRNATYSCAKNMGEGVVP